MSAPNEPRHFVWSGEAAQTRMKMNRLHFNPKSLSLSDWLAVAHGGTLQNRAGHMDTNAGLGGLSLGFPTSVASVRPIVSFTKKPVWESLPNKISLVDTWSNFHCKIHAQYRVLQGRHFHLTVIVEYTYCSLSMEDQWHLLFSDADIKPWKSFGLLLMPTSLCSFLPQDTV